MNKLSITGIKGKFLWLLPSIFAIILYSQTYTHEYISYDDSWYTFDNPVVPYGITWEGIKWSTMYSQLANYHPVTWWSHMLDFMLFGNSPGMFALENGFIHALNALLVTLLLAKVFKSKPEAIIGGLIFAVHPLLIEAVAWISQRKTLLSTFWALLSMFLYLRFLDYDKARVRFLLYTTSIFCFIISLLSKCMYVTLPALLVLLEAMYDDRKRSIYQSLCIPYFESRFLPLLTRLLPYGILAIIFSYIAIWSQSSGGAISSLSQMPIIERIGNILYSYFIYIRQFFYPHGLSIFYDFHSYIGLLDYLLYGFFLTTISVLLYVFHKHLGVYPIIGWLFFILSLLPVIGIVQIGDQSHADRYMYGPIIGLVISTIAIGKKIISFSESKAIRITSILSVSCWVIFLCIDSYFSIEHWKNDLTISIATLKNYPNNPAANHIFATGLLKQGKYKEARDIISNLYSYYPEKHFYCYNLALCELLLGNTDKAIEYQKNYCEKVTVPGAGLPNLAKFYCILGDYKKAEEILKDINSHNYSFLKSERIILKEVEEGIKQHASEE